MKTCNRCQTPKPEEEFPLRSKKKGTRQGYCRSCKKEMQSDWYRRNKQVHCANILEDKRRRKERINPVIRKLKEEPCLDCGKRFPYYVTDFDHRPGEKKLFDISRSLHRYSFETVMAEIAKCDLLCANCHRIRTHARQFGKVA